VAAAGEGRRMAATASEENGGDGERGEWRRARAGERAAKGISLKYVLSPDDHFVTGFVVKPVTDVR
jgi:hypothetical protein